MTSDFSDEAKKSLDFIKKNKQFLTETEIAMLKKLDIDFWSDKNEQQPELSIL